MTDPRHRNRVLGSLLGTAVGDCLGTPIAGLHPSTIRDRHGVVSTHIQERPIWTSSTQQALTLAEATVRRGSPDPSWIGQRWIEMATPYPGHPLGIHRGANPAFIESIEALRRAGDWRASGQAGDAGCANAVRVVPVATALAHVPSDVLADMIVDVSLLTHRELRAIAVALAAGWTASQLCREPGYPLPAARGRALLEELAEWLRDREKRLLPEIEGVWVAAPSHVHDVSTVLAGLARRFDDGWPAARGWLEQYASARLGRPAQASEGCVLCAVPAALAIVLGASRRLEETLVSALALGYDTVTLGALVGGLAGAAAGERAIPARWRRIEGWEALVAWGDALACCTPADATGEGAAVDCPGPENLPDVLALERHLTVLAAEVAGES
jgi:ADP-ribosyl-[dinitrogen reductase] hydrolase